MLAQALKSLRLSDRALLLCSLESGDTQILRLPNNHFIGVNVTVTPDVIILEEKGHWSYGQFTAEASGRYSRCAETSG